MTPDESSPKGGWPQIRTRLGAEEIAERRKRAACDGMRGLLDAEPGTEVVGEASSGEEAIELAEKPQPDVILMDKDARDQWYRGHP